MNDPEKAWQGVRKWCLCAHTISILVLLCLLYSAPPALGLEPETKLVDYRYRHWNVEHGLPHAVVRSLKQSADGYLWTGSDIGLARFDGDQFLLTHSAPPPETTPYAINCLWTQKNAVLWTGGKEGAISQYTNGHLVEIIPAGTLRGLGINCFFEDRRGRVWVGTTQGVRLFEAGNRLAPVFTNATASVNAILEDNTGQLWFATQKGVFVCQSTNLNTFTRFEIAPEIPIYDLSSSQSGSMWMGSAEGLLHYSGGRLGTYTKDHGLKDNRVYSLYRDSQGTLWLGTAQGINRFYKTRIQSESTIPTLNNTAIFNFMEDREQGLWIASASGIHCLNDRIFTTFSANKGLPEESITSLAERKPGHFLVGTTERGLFELSATGLTAIRNTSSSFISSLLIDREDRIWIGVRRKGLDLFDKDRIINYNQSEHGLSDNIVFSLCEDRRGRLWIGTANGVNCRADDALRTFPLPSSTNVSVRAIKELKNGELWFGTSEGVFTVTPASTNHFNVTHGLPDNLVYCIQQDSNDRVWAGTANGMAFFMDNQWHALPNPIPFSRHHVFWIADDGNGCLWYSSPSGIYKLSLENVLKHFQSPAVEIQRRLFTQADGLLSMECRGGSQPAGCQTSDGKLLFPTRKGIAMVDPRRMPVNVVPPPVHLQQILVDGHPFPASNNICLPAGTRLVEFHYAALSFSEMDKVLYQRQLHGIDNGWSQLEKRRSAAYANLAPGAYQFQVIACNNDGVWNRTGASIAFTIRPFFYQTTWFYALGILSLIFFAFGWHAWHTRLLRQQKAVLQQLVHERTLELENQMLQRLTLEEKLQDSRKLEAVGQLASGVAHYFNNLLAIIQGNASLLKDEFGGKESAASIDDIDDATQRGAHLVRQLLAFTRRHWLKLEPLDLHPLLANHLETLREKVRAPISIIGRFPPGPARVMANSEALEQAISGLTANALEAMADGGTLSVSTSEVEISEKQTHRHPESIPGKFIQLTLSDTGKGMPPDVLHRMFEPFFTTKDVGQGTGLGLAAVYGIIKQHNGWIEAESTPEHGTTIRVLLPKENAA